MSDDDDFSDDTLAHADDEVDERVEGSEWKRTGRPGPSWSVPQPVLYSLDVKKKTISKHEYIYRALPIPDVSVDLIAGPHFRLLQILAGQPDDSIYGRLMVRPVFDAPGYIALSYSWGIEPPLSWIYLGPTAQPFPVTDNLWSALHRMRQQTRNVTVWVDAVCINQHDLVERAAQVHIMAQIFNQAREVTIWLGQTPQIPDNVSSEDRDFFAALSQQPTPWWERLWVIQECAYASSCPTVLLPDATISLYDLIQRWATVVEAQSDDSLLRALQMLRLPYDIWKTQYETNTHRLPLLTRMRETSQLHCSDPHDRVYAILSLVDESEAATIVPDYRKSFETLMTEIDIILGTSSLSAPIFGSDVWVSPARLLNFYKVSWNPMPPLQECARFGDIEGVKRLIGEQTNVNEHGGHYGTALQAAAVGGFLGIVHLLLDSGATSYSTTGIYGSPLYAAASLGHNEIVRMLLVKTHSDDPNKRRYYSCALFAALANGHREVARQLMEKFEWSYWMHDSPWFREAHHCALLAAVHRQDAQSTRSLTAFWKQGSIRPILEDFQVARLNALSRGYDEIADILDEGWPASPETS